MDDFGDEGFQGDAFDFAFDGHCDEALEGGAEGQGEAEGVAGDDFSGLLALFQKIRDVGEGGDEGGVDFGVHTGAALGLEHECEKGGMFEGETDVGVGGFCEACLEIAGTSLGGPGHDGTQSVEAHGSEGVDEVLFGGEMALGRGVAYAKLAAEFTKGQLLDAAGLEGGFGGAQEGLGQIAVVVGAGGRLHTLRRIRCGGKNIQHVVIDNNDDIAYIALHENNQKQNPRCRQRPGRARGALRLGLQIHHRGMGAGGAKG